MVNNVNNNSGDGIYDYSAGYGDTIEYNSAQYNGRSTNTPGGNSGIEISSTINTVTINSNVANYNKADGIYLNNASYATVDFDQANNNGRNGFELNTSTGDFVEVDYVANNGANGIEVSSGNTGSLLADSSIFGNGGRVGQAARTLMLPTTAPEPGQPEPATRGRVTGA